MPITVATGMRNPRMHGAPPICMGFTAIRVNFVSQPVFAFVPEAIFLFFFIPLDSLPFQKSLACRLLTIILA
jgi:hypothetical protein